MERRRKQFSLSTFAILSICFLTIIFLLIGRATENFADFQSFTQNFFPNLELVLFLAVLILSIFAAIFLTYNSNLQKSLVKTIDLSGVDKMTGTEFEKYIGEILKSQGYKIQLTAGSHDYGVDIIARQDNTKIAVQLKRYSSSVGRSAISDAVAGLAHYKCNKSMVITNHYFTKEAKILAESNNCELINRDELARWIYNFSNS